MISKTSLAALLLAATAVPALAAAQEATPTPQTDSNAAAGDAAGAEEPTGPLEVDVGIAAVSDYRFRGISLSNSKIAVQPYVTLTHESGLYVGTWASTLPDSDLYGRAEVDLYAGYATEIASGTTVDLGLTYYWYPGGKEDVAGPSDYFEPALKLSHTLGPVEATGTVAYAWKQAALGDEDNIYAGLDLAAGIPDTPVTLKAGVGYSDGSLALLAADGDYWDWSLGADVTVDAFTIGVRYVDTDIDKIGDRATDRLYKPGLVFSIGADF